MDTFMFHHCQQRNTFTIDEKKINWNAENEAKFLYRAMKGKQADSIITDILGNLNHCRRVRLIKAYREYTSRKLSHDIRADLAGDFEFTSQSVIVDPVIFLVKNLENALNEFPTPRHDYVLYHLCERSNFDARSILEAYHKRYGLLKQKLDDNLNPDCSRLVQQIINPFRQEGHLSPIQVYSDAQDLVKFGIGTQFGDESEPAIYAIIRQRPYDHIRAVITEYKRLTGRGCESSLGGEMPERQRLWLRALIEAIINPQLYCAKILAKCASRNHQTFLNCLLILRQTRTIVFFRNAVQLYYEIRGEKIQDTIKRSFDGNAKALLLTLMDV